MIYPYTCQACGASEERNVSVADRDRPMIPCVPCGTFKERDVSAQFRSQRIFTPKMWCACTAADLTPTREDNIAYEKSLSELSAPEKKPSAFQVAREQIAAGVL